MGAPVSFPVIRLELEGMRHTVLHAFAQQTAQMDQILQSELDRFCSEDNLRAIVAAQVKESIQSAIKQEIASFYGYGKGREIIKAAVIAELSKVNPWD